ncbi:hypothetical protein, partial [Herpetosiphon giganteus]|uniref:hypothetical protein n=1 Tax=Herpetosiphon giganteus TaxID=2029754 RepID=UPI00195AB46D
RNSINKVNILKNPIRYKNFLMLILYSSSLEIDSIIEIEKFIKDQSIDVNIDLLYTIIKDNKNDLIKNKGKIMNEIAIYSLIDKDKLNNIIKEFRDKKLDNDNLFKQRLNYYIPISKYLIKIYMNYIRFLIKTVLLPMNILKILLHIFLSGIQYKLIFLSTFSWFQNSEKYNHPSNTQMI